MTGTETVNVTVNGPQNELIAATETVSVEPPSLAGFGDTFVEQQGVGFDVQLGKLVDPNVSDTAGDFVVTANFGDGTSPVSATVTGSNGLFNIDPTHTYANAGTYSIQVVVSQIVDGVIQKALVIDDTCFVKAVDKKDAPSPAPLQSTITLKGNSKSSTEAGKYTPKGRAEIVSTAKQVAEQAKDIANYDGPVGFDAKYKIVLKADGTVDTDKSTVKFTQLYYTAFGKKTDEQPFVTDEIKITGAELTADKKSVKSFTFEGTNWYDKKDGSSNLIVNNGLSGRIDFETDTGNFTAKYILKKNAVNCIYKVTAKID